MPKMKRIATGLWQRCVQPCAAQIQAGLAAFLCDGLITLIFVFVMADVLTWRSAGLSFLLLQCIVTWDFLVQPQGMSYE